MAVLIVRRMRGSDIHHAMRGWPRIQDVETDLPLRSHSTQRLNASQGTGSGGAGACPALAEGCQSSQSLWPCRRISLNILRCWGSLDGPSGRSVRRAVR